MNIIATDPRDDFEKAFPIPKHVIRCGNGYACTEYNAWGAYEFIHKWEGWRAAMLKAAPAVQAEPLSVDTLANVLRNAPVAPSDNQGKKRGNSPAIPDYWTGSDKANAALVMLDRIDTLDPVDDDRIEGIKRIIRELAAEPKQEAE